MTLPLTFESVRKGTLARETRLAAQDAGVGRGLGRNNIEPDPLLPISERDQDFILRYRRGETLAEIGAVYGLTRERVRQRLALHGMNAASGGAHLQAVQRAHGKHLRRLQSQRDQVNRVFGVSLEVFYEIAGITKFHSPDALRKTGHPIVAPYISQKNYARLVGAAWEFDLASWWQLWQESGHWMERGRGMGYCMSRVGDSGPYSPANVVICTCSQNMKDSYITKPASERLKKRYAGVEIKGYSRIKGCKTKPFQAYFQRQYLGYFATEAEAHNAYLAARDAAS